MERKKPTKFVPGMKCSGCGKTLDTRKDCHADRLMCYPCGQHEAKEAQRRLRESRRHKCLDCPRHCGRDAERCGKCAQRHLKRNPPPKLPKVNRMPLQFTGLRGPGGEMNSILQGDVLERWR